MKNIVLLGTTGSIGTQTLEIIKNNQDKMKLHACSFHKNIDNIPKIKKLFKPFYILITDTKSYEKVAHIPGVISIKESALIFNDAHIVVNAISKFEGARWSYETIKRGIHLALANKESLVSCGEFLTQLCIKTGSKIFPVDSEHSAIWQALQGEKREDVAFITLTASGGAFRDKSRSEIEKAKAVDALKHPTWSMGKKITIDSATLMNKGFEAIEARWLFDIPMKDIHVAIHRESIVHSAVHYVDGSVIAQLSKPSMLLPIQYALLEKERQPLLEPMYLEELSGLSFSEIDHDRFPAYKYAVLAAEEGGILPAVLNVANDLCVEAYLKDKIAFYDFYPLIEEVLSTTTNVMNYSMEDVYRVQEKTQLLLKEKIYGNA